MKINLKVTTKCPAKCICCKERLSNFKKFNGTERTTAELFDKILTLYREVGDKENHLSITGGEPTLICNLADYVSKASMNNITVGLDTNGWNINWNWLKEMEQAGLKYILFSVYSLDKNTYKYLRGSENGFLFERMIKTLNILKEYKANGGTIQIRLQTVLMKPNFRELDNLLEEAILAHFNSLSTAYYISYESERNILMNQSDIECFITQVCPKMISIMEKYNISSIIIEENERKIRTFFSMDGISLQELSEGIYRRKGFNCGENNCIAIYPNGVIVPCLGFDYSMDETYTLNIFDKKQYEIFLNERFRNFWENDYVLCTRCSSGHQVWLNLLSK